MSRNESTDQCAASGEFLSRINDAGWRAGYAAALQKAARIYDPLLPTLAELTKGPRTTVGQLAERLYSGQTYDYSLPQQWVDQHQSSYPYGNIAGGFVWLYTPHSAFGQPAPLYREAAAWLAQLEGAPRV